MIDKALFLDRDGVLVKASNNSCRYDDVEFYPDVFASLQILKRRFFIIIVTNQPGIENGDYTICDFRLSQRKLMKMLFASSGVVIDSTYFCPHSIEEKCDCRKPSPVLLLRACNDFGVSISESYIIGNKESDMEAGKRAGCTSVLMNREIGPPNSMFGADISVSNLWNFTELQLKR